MKHIRILILFFLGLLLSTCMDEEEQVFNSLGTLGKPKLLLPKDSIYPLQNLNFKWEINEPKDNFEYKLYVWEEGSDKKEIGSTKETAYTMKANSFRKNKVYKWEVLVVNPQIGLSNTSVEGTFKTKKESIVLESLIFPTKNKMSLDDTIQVKGLHFGTSGRKLTVLLGKDSVNPISQSDTLLKFILPQVFTNEVSIQRAYSVGNQSIVEKFPFKTSLLADTVFPFLFHQISIHSIAVDPSTKKQMITFDYQGKGFGKSFEAFPLVFKIDDYAIVKEDIVEFTDARVRVKVMLDKASKGKFSVHYKKLVDKYQSYEFYELSPGLIRQDEPNKKLVIRGIGLTQLGKQVLQISQINYNWEKSIDQIISEHNGVLSKDSLVFDLEIAKSVSGNVRVVVKDGNTEKQVGFFSVLTQKDILKFDKNILKEIYQKNGGPLWSKINPPNAPIIPKKSWVLSNELHTWAGVKVSNEYGVEALDLSNFGMLGTLTEDIKDLNSLTSLDISNNKSLKGTLPKILCDKIKEKKLTVKAEFTNYNDLCLTVTPQLTKTSYFLDEKITLSGKDFINGEVQIRLFHQNDAALAKPLDTLSYSQSDFSPDQYKFSFLNKKKKLVHDTTYMFQLVVNNRFLNRWNNIQVHKRPTFTTDLGKGTYYYDRVVRIIGTNFPKKLEQIEAFLVDGAREIPVQLVTTQFSRTSFSFRLPKQASFAAERKFGLKIKMYGNTIKEWKDVNVSSSDVLTNLTNTNIYKDSKLIVRTEYKDNRNESSKYALVIKDRTNQQEYATVTSTRLSKNLDSVEYTLTLPNSFKTWSLYDVDMRYNGEILETWTDVSIRKLPSINGTNVGQQVLFYGDTIRFNGADFPHEANLTKLIISRDNFKDTLSIIPYGETKQFHDKVEFKLSIEPKHLNHQFSVKLYLEGYTVHEYINKYLFRYPEITGSRISQQTYFKGDKIPVTADHIMYTKDVNIKDQPKLDFFKLIVKDINSALADTLVATEIEGKTIRFTLPALKHINFSSSFDRTLSVLVRDKIITPSTWNPNSFREPSQLVNTTFNAIYYTSDTVFIRINPKKGPEDVQVDFRLLSFINGKMESSAVSEYLHADYIPFKLTSFTPNSKLELGMMFKHDTVFRNQVIELRPEPTVSAINQNYIIQTQVIEIDGNHFIDDHTKIKLDFNYFQAGSFIKKHTLTADAKSTNKKLYFTTPEDVAKLDIKTYKETKLYVDNRFIKDFGEFPVKKKPVSKQAIKPYYYEGDTLTIDGQFFNTDPNKAYLVLRDPVNSSADPIKLNSFKVEPSKIYVKIDDRIPLFKSYKISASHDGIELATGVTVDFRKYPTIDGNISKIIFKQTNDTIRGKNFPRKGVNTPTPKYVLKYDKGNKEIVIPDDNVKENYIWFNSDFTAPFSQNYANDFDFEVHLDGRRIKKWESKFSYRPLPVVTPESVQSEWYSKDSITFKFTPATVPNTSDYTTYNVLITKGSTSVSIPVVNPNLFDNKWGVLVPESPNGIFGEKDVKIQLFNGHHLLFTKEKVSLLKLPEVLQPTSLAPSYFVVNDSIKILGTEFLDKNSKVRLYGLRQDKTPKMELDQFSFSKTKIVFPFKAISSGTSSFEKLEFIQNGRIWRTYVSNFRLITDPKVTNTPNDYYFNSLDTVKLEGEYFPANKSDVTIRLESVADPSVTASMSIVKYLNNKLEATFYRGDKSLIPAGIYKLKFVYRNKSFFISNNITVSASPVITTDNIPSSKRLYTGDTVALFGNSIQIKDYKLEDFKLKIANSATPDRYLKTLSPISKAFIESKAIRFKLENIDLFLSNSQDKLLRFFVKNRKIDWTNLVSIRNIPRISNSANLEGGYFYVGDTIEFTPDRNYIFPEFSNYNVVNFEFDKGDPTLKLNILNPNLNGSKWISVLATAHSPKLNNIVRKAQYSPTLTVDGKVIHQFNSVRIWNKPQSDFLNNLARYYYNDSEIVINGSHFYIDKANEGKPAYLVFHRKSPSNVSDTLMAQLKDVTDTQIKIKTITTKGTVSTDYVKAELFVNNHKVSERDVNFDTRNKPLITTKLQDYYFISKNLTIDGDGFKTSAKLVLTVASSLVEKAVVASSIESKQIIFTLDQYQDGTPIREVEFSKAVLHVDGTEIAEVPMKSDKLNKFIFANSPTISSCNFASSFGNRFYVGDEYSLSGTNFFRNSSYVDKNTYRIFVSRLVPDGETHSAPYYTLIDTVDRLDPTKDQLFFTIDAKNLVGSAAKAIDPNKVASNLVDVYVDDTRIHRCVESFYLRNKVKPITTPVFTDSSFVFKTEKLIIPNEAWQDKEFPQMERDYDALTFKFFKNVGSTETLIGQVGTEVFTEVGNRIIIGDYSKKGVTASYTQPYKIKLEIDNQAAGEWANVFLVDKLPKAKPAKRVYYLGQNVEIETADLHSFFGTESRFDNKWKFTLYTTNAKNEKVKLKDVPITTKSTTKFSFNLPSDFSIDFYKDYHFKALVMNRELYSDFQPIQFRKPISVSSDLKDNLIRFHAKHDTIKGSNFPTGKFLSDNRVQLTCDGRTPKDLTLDANSTNSKIIFKWPDDDINARVYYESAFNSPTFGCAIQYKALGYDAAVHSEQKISYRPDPQISTSLNANGQVYIRYATNLTLNYNPGANPANYALPTASEYNNIQVYIAGKRLDPNVRQTQNATFTLSESHKGTFARRNNLEFKVYFIQTVDGQTYKTLLYEKVGNILLDGESEP